MDHDHEHDYLDIRRIVLSALEECSQCRQAHSIDDFRVVEQRGHVWMLVMRCAYCDSEAFVAAVIGDEGTDEADLELPDALVLAEEPWDDEPAEEPEAVTATDVLEIHEFLETFDGNFQALFARRR